MIKTMYGFIPNEFLKEFERVSGNYLVEGEWSLAKDEVEYWQLTNPTSMVPEKKWQKRLGYLPIRDLNFEYACYQCPKFVTTEEGVEIKEYDVLKAIEYAKAKLFRSGKPVYLPEILAEKSNPMYDLNTKPPKSYNKILDEEKHNFFPEQ